MDSLVWGPHGWIFLHTITLAYPDCPNSSDKEAIKNFFNNLGPVLPCDKCRINFGKHLKKFPLTDKVLCSRESLTRWLVDIHNEVNEMNGKEKITYEEFLVNYMNMFSGRRTFWGYITNSFDIVRSNLFHRWYFIGLFGLILFIIIVVILYFVIKKYQMSEK